MTHSISKEILNKREKINCIYCSQGKFSLKYIKRSRNREPFAIAKCRNCGLLFVNRRPKTESLYKYYSMEYFSKRDDRGYEDYLSDKQGNEVLRVLGLNLKDLGFFPWEKNKFSCLRHADQYPRMLDIGAASGLAVKWFQDRNWNAEGVEVAEDLAQKGSHKYQVKISIGDFLELSFPQAGYDLITMFATIEHLPEPVLFLKKISGLLKKDGRLVITTCRANFWNFRILFGRNWRFFNVPEHLFYFSSGKLNSLLKQSGMKKVKMITYGSGFKGWKKKIADVMAKYFRLGDMMAIVYEKR